MPHGHRRLSVKILELNIDHNISVYLLKYLLLRIDLVYQPGNFFTLVPISPQKEKKLNRVIVIQIVPRINHDLYIGSS